MKIHMLRPLLNEGNPVVRQIWPVGKVSWQDVWSFACEPRRDVWPAMGAPVKFLDTTLPLGEVPFVGHGAFALSSEVRPRFGETISNAEELPMHTSGGHHFIMVNLLNCSDCADGDASEWWPLPGFTERHRVKRYHFVPERLPGVSLFKANLYKWHIFATEGYLPASSEFSARYRDLGARGIEFVEVWNDEGRAVPELDMSGY